MANRWCSKGGCDRSTEETLLTASWNVPLKPLEVRPIEESVRKLSFQGIFDTIFCRLILFM